MTANLIKVSRETLANVQSDPTLIETLVMDTIQGTADPGDGLDLYKSWNAMHVLLNDGACGAESDAIMGGTPIGEDLGFGPARFLNDREVADISAALSRISTSDFESRFDVAKMKDVYAFHQENADDEWPILSKLFAETKTFYASAAQATNGVILFLI
ncbi:MAG: YfbM family protein [Planctomycetota bacterium]